MKSSQAAEYLAHAMESREAANRIKDPDLRDAFLRVAQEWERMAKECTLGTSDTAQEKPPE